MITPKLVHPVEIKYQNVDQSSSNINPFWGEPDKSVKDDNKIQYKSETKTIAQVEILSTDKQVAKVGGPQLKGNGYMLMYNADAEKVFMGARVNSIAGNSTEYFVNARDNTVHYATSRMKKVWFATRDFARNT